MLRPHSAIINLASGKITLSSEGYEWTAEIIGSSIAPQYRNSYHVREIIRTPIEDKEIVTESALWQEILSFQGKGYAEAISVEQKKKLIDIYKTCNVFSDSPGKAHRELIDYQLSNLFTEFLSVILAKERQVIANIQKEFDNKMFVANGKIEELQNIENKQKKWIEEIEKENDHLTKELTRTKDEKDVLNKQLIDKSNEFVMKSNELTVVQTKLTQAQSCLLYTSRCV